LDRVVCQSSFSAQKTFAGLFGWQRHDSHLNLDCLPLGHAGVFFELDRPAVDFAVKCPGNGGSSQSFSAPAESEL
jgi:hypothetical protein